MRRKIKVKYCSSLQKLDLSTKASQDHIVIVNSTEWNILAKFWYDRLHKVVDIVGTTKLETTT